jgi:BolA family transcriptional regulator, general stress-responsive regulator
MNESQDRINLIKTRLEEALTPEYLDIIDDSHLHIGHRGAKENGGGHYSIEIISDTFKDKAPLERHKMIYLALGDAMGKDIHALSINAKTIAEAQTSIEKSN